MLCKRCAGECQRYGRNRNKSQRYRCEICKLSYTDESTRPPDRRELEPATRIMALRLFLEGNSIRSTERLLGINRDTIMNLIVEAGDACRGFHADFVRDVPAVDVQADEVWGFVGCKERTRERNEYGPEKGDAYTFTAMERETKFLLAWQVGKRDAKSTERFCYKLKHAARRGFQISTDGFGPYGPELYYAFGQIDHARVIKVFAPVPESKGASRYSPPKVVEVKKTVQMGEPDLNWACTSHVERQNLNIRMAIRRMTRLTNAHSKKWWNHDAALSLYFTYYNFCRVHSSMETTPAVEQRLTDHVWSVAELVGRIGL